MIGYYNYTVWLTYASLLSASLGIGVSLHGAGHPYWGVFFLLLSGLCDAFDGRVARRKKNRSQMEKKYGIQIDSLADLVAFGVLPACIGEALSTLGPYVAGVRRLDFSSPQMRMFVRALVIAVMLFYVLAALIRLAYFNVAEEERQNIEGGSRKTYEGLPVTSAALIFPTIMLLQYVLPMDITLVYYIGMLITGALFISRIQVVKPGFRGILIMVLFGAAEAVLLLVGLFTIAHR